MDAAEHPVRGIGNDRPPITPETSRASDNDEWAWMVAEDPAFYLTGPGKAENTRA